jgi:YD repeat-containing protein
LEEKIDYAFSNPNFVRKEKYNYSPAILKTIDYWEVPKLYHTGMPSTCDYVQACCPRDPDANTNRYILGQFDGGFRSTTEIWYRLIGTETTEGGVQQVRSLEYKPINQVTNLPQHTNPIKTEETLSNGNIKQNYLYYSGDTDPDNPSIKLGLSEMWDITNPAFKNYITPVIKTRTFVNNTLIAKEAHHFSFDPVNSFILRTGYETLPRGVEAGKVTWSYGYDNRAKMVRIGKVGDVEKAYIWGYNHTYPVAEVIGESFAHVTAGLNLSIIDNVNGVYSEQQVRDELNKIRINFPNAHVTTYTYQPLLGMKSQTDVDGRTTYFEYDLYGRLKLIKNMDGKILKSYEYKYAQ